MFQKIVRSLIIANKYLSAIYLCEETIDLHALGDVKDIKSFQITSIEIKNTLEFFETTNTSAKILSQEIKENKVKILYTVPLETDLSDFIVTYTINGTRRISSFVEHLACEKNNLETNYLNIYHEGKLKVLIEKGLRLVGKLLNKKQTNEFLCPFLTNGLLNAPSGDLEAYKKIFISFIKDEDPITLLNFIESFMSSIRNGKYTESTRVFSKTINNKLLIEKALIMRNLGFKLHPQLIFYDINHQILQIVLIYENLGNLMIVKSSDLPDIPYVKVNLRIRKDKKEKLYNATLNVLQIRR